MFSIKDERMFTMIYNFSAGPAILPKDVLKEAQTFLLDYKDSGMSVMEMSHRSSHYLTIHEEAKILLKELMNIPDNYSILFLQGGASLQFTMAPLNLNTQKPIAFIDTGVWSQKAIEEAKRLNREVIIIASSKEQNYQEIPSHFDTLSEEFEYLHLTTNNTIEGTAFKTIPSFKNTKIVADMSSNILSNRYQTTDFDLIYAGAQKNMGPSGVTVVIIKNELLSEQNELPPMLSYAAQQKSDSLYNTPPTFSIYMMSLVLKWVKAFGGVEQMTTFNEEKAAILYDYLDHSKLFSSPVNPNSRSLMNIPFTTGNRALDTELIDMATKNGLLNLKGYRTVGGMRASIYNAMPKEGVEALVDLLHTFEQEKGN